MRSNEIEDILKTFFVKQAKYMTLVHIICVR